MKYLLFLSKNYSYPILKPIHDAILKRPHDTIFWCSILSERFEIDSQYWLESNNSVVDYSPDAVLVPGNIVPYRWPGLKVQIFHGLGEEKSGHYSVNGLFDLYCTPGPVVTAKLKNYIKDGRFAVEETGWPKLDAIGDFGLRKKRFFNNKYSTILYAPTFSTKLTSAVELYETIKKLQNLNYNWIVKFHELTDRKIIKRYKKLENQKFKVVEKHDVLPLMHESDILLTDTSSVAYEYLLFDKPLITFKAKSRTDKGINIELTEDLEGAIIRAKMNPDEFKDNRQYYLSELHPYQDGKSSERVLDAVNKLINNGYMRKKNTNIKYFYNRWKTRKYCLND